MYIQFQFRSQHQTYLQTKCQKRTSKNESISAVGPPNLGRAQAPYSALSFCLLGKT